MFLGFRFQTWVAGLESLVGSLMSPGTLQASMSVDAPPSIRPRARPAMIAPTSSRLAGAPAAQIVAEPTPKARRANRRFLTSMVGVAIRDRGRLASAESMEQGEPALEYCLVSSLGDCGQSSIRKTHSTRHISGWIKVNPPWSTVWFPVLVIAFYQVKRHTLYGAYLGKQDQPQVSMLFK